MSDERVPIAIVGAGGRMGRAILRLAADDPTVRVVGASDRADAPEIGRDAGEIAGAAALGVEVAPDIPSALLGAKVVIDFSSAGVTNAVAHAAEREGCAIICGTTGLSKEGEGALEQASRKVAVLHSPNMSLGVHVLSTLVTAAVRALPGFDVEIVEAHHRAKVDAPSGTAVRLFDAVKAAKEARAVYGREGRPGARMADEVAVLALRGGDVIGDHTVHLMGFGERLELTHRATNRDVFAHGALFAARVIATFGKGRYTMADIVDRGLSR